MVDRPTFESRLHSYLERKTTSHDDLAWFALRYTVYASGCRIILSKLSPSTPFAEAQERAWQFFENALSVHTELLYCTSSLLAVQALAAMVRLPTSLSLKDQILMYFIVLTESLRGMPRKSSTRLYALLLCCTASTVKRTSSSSGSSLELVGGGDTTSKSVILGDLYV